MKKQDKITIETSAAREIYNSVPQDGKIALERLLGRSVLTELPLGVWCLTTDGSRHTPEEWNKGLQAQGVLVVTETMAFIVAPHASVALQWGAMGKEQSQLITDKDSNDAKAATDAMLKAYKGTIYEDKDDNIWNVEGAPAAEWVRAYSYGSIGVGQWDLPTITQLKAMHTYRNEINDCLKAIGGYKLTPSFHWSSIGYADNSKGAWAVGTSNGDVGWIDKSDISNVRAVSAFPMTLNN